jgi:hypothetical protein
VADVGVPALAETAGSIRVPKRGKITANDKLLRDRVVGNGRVFRQGDSRKGAKPQRRRERKKTNMTENEVAKIVVDAGYGIHISA